jgi:hypothetical protein
VRIIAQRCDDIHLFCCSCWLVLDHTATCVKTSNGSYKSCRARLALKTGSEGRLRRKPTKIVHWVPSFPGLVCLESFPSHLSRKPLPCLVFASYCLSDDVVTSFDLEGE